MKHSCMGDQGYYYVASQNYYPLATNLKSCACLRSSHQLYNKTPGGSSWCMGSSFISLFFYFCLKQQEHIQIISAPFSTCAMHVYQRMLIKLFVNQHLQEVSAPTLVYVPCGANPTQKSIHFDHPGHFLSAHWGLRMLGAGKPLHQIDTSNAHYHTNQGICGSIDPTNCCVYNAQSSRLQTTAITNFFCRPTCFAALLVSKGMDVCFYNIFQVLLLIVQLRDAFAGIGVQNKALRLHFCFTSHMNSMNKQCTVEVQVNIVLFCRYATRHGRLAARLYAQSHPNLCHLSHNTVARIVNQLKMAG